MKDEDLHWRPLEEAPTRRIVLTRRRHALGYHYILAFKALHGRWYGADGRTILRPDQWAELPEIEEVHK